MLNDLLIDVKDKHYLSKYQWRTLLCNKKLYVVATTKNNRLIRLHRLILSAPKDKQVDHINGNTLDNRRINLRIVTPSQNAQNKITQSNNKSGVTGVYWNKYYESWIAQVRIEGKTVQRKHKTFAKAVEARRLLQEQYFGEYSHV